MTHIIEEIYDHTRLASAECSTEFFFKFYAPMARGEPLSPEVLALTPDPYFVDPPERGDLPDMFDGKTFWTVSEKVKRIIEDLEPSVHTFIRVNVRIRNSDKDCGSYYLLYVGQSIDAIVIEQTRFRDGYGVEGFKKSPVLSDAVLDGRLIAGKHLWRGGVGKLGGGGDPFSRYLFVSDELAKRIKSAGLDGWIFETCKVQG